MKPAESYFRSLYYLSTAGAAAAKPSYYPALANLLNDLGRGLKPRVRCLLNLKELGPGLPDGGLVMCHPGFVDAELKAIDSLTDLREQEFAFFASDAFPEIMAAHSVELERPR